MYGIQNIYKPLLRCKWFIFIPVNLPCFAGAVIAVLKGTNNSGPKIPNVTWKDVGGLSSIKSELIDSIQLPLQFPKLFSSGIKRSGQILL